MNQKISRFFAGVPWMNLDFYCFRAPCCFICRSFSMGRPVILRAKAKAPRATKLSIGTTPFSAQRWWGCDFCPGDVVDPQGVIWEVPPWVLKDGKLVQDFQSRRLVFFIRDHSQGKVHIGRSEKSVTWMSLDPFIPFWGENLGPKCLPSSWKKGLEKSVAKKMAKKKQHPTLGSTQIGANKDPTLAGAKDPIFYGQLTPTAPPSSPRSSFAFITCLTRRLRKKKTWQIHANPLDGTWQFTWAFPLPWPFSLQNGESMILYQINSGIQNDWPFKIFKMTQICRFCSPFLNRFCNIQIAMWTGHSGQTSETQDRYCLNYRVFLQMCIVSHENAV